MNLFLRLCLCGLFFCGFCTQVAAQRYLADYDSTLFIRDTVRPVIKRFENLSITGYMQPQYQVAQSKGIDSYSGGDFSRFSDNRFMLRRARVKLDYMIPVKESSFPLALFTFQFEATERDVNIRDMFVRIYEPKLHNFSLTMGLFSRPFGFEVNLSSAFRETPERGRMSQILMPSERDLGAMVTYESQKKKKKVPIKFDIGVFNGQGKSGPAEFDAYKDLISRITFKPISVASRFTLSGGLSYLNGGWRQATKYKYETASKEGNTYFAVDSSLSNLGDKAPRIYHGADAQISYKHGWGKTELRGEYWWGTQPGTATMTSNPGELPEEPTYIRPFSGAFFYIVQNIINNKNELIVKYDWYDPNRKAQADDIGGNGSNLTAADIRYSTLGAGFAHYLTPNLKALIYYDMVTNEETGLTGYTKDIKDNVLTVRLQLRF